MPDSRIPTSVVRAQSRLWALACLLGAASPAAATDRSPAPVPLAPGAPISSSLAAGQSHVYEVRAAEGDVFGLELQEHGICLVLTIIAPEERGGLTLEEDGANDHVSLRVVAESDGPHHITVRPCYEEAEAGTYRIALAEPRPATPRDRQAFQAHVAEARVSVLLHEDTAEALSAATREAERAVEAWRALGEDERLARALDTLGACRSVSNEGDAAIQLWNEAAAVAARAGSLREEALAWIHLGYEEATRGNPTEAIVLITRGAGLARQAGAGWAVAFAGQLLSYCHSVLGDVQRSLDHARQALALARSAHEADLEGYLLLRIGNTYAELGHHRRALEHMEAALVKMRATRQGRPVAHILSNIGVLHVELRQWREGRARLEEALALERRNGSLVGQAGTLKSLGRVHAAEGDFEGALQRLQEGLVLAEQAKLPYMTSSVLRVMGNTYLAQKRPDQAAAQFERALEIARAAKAPQDEGLAFLGLAEAEEAQGRLVEAAAHVEAGLGLMEGLRENPAEASARAAFLASVRRLYDVSTRILVRRHRERPGEGHDRAALVMSERGRARALLDQLAPASGDRTPPDPVLAERARALRDELEARARQKGGATELQRLLSEQEVVRAEIRRRQSAPAVGSALSSFEAIQALLDPDTVLLEYLLGQDGGLVFAVTREGLATAELPARSVIDEKARRLHALVTARKDRVPFETAAERSRRWARADAEYERLAREMSELLLRPVADRLARRLVVVADGPLHYVPFAALPDPTSAGARLIEGHEITHLPSASVLATLRAQAELRPRPLKTVAVLADPVFDEGDPRVLRSRAGTARVAAEPSLRDLENGELRAALETTARGSLKRLPATRREAMAILALVPGAAAQSALDFEASRESALSPALADFRLVHFATHGHLDGRDPRLSALVLSLVDRHGAPQDGFLRLSDVQALRLNADLVGLSGCETALGEEVNGEGLVGLTHAFLHAGAQRVLATLWRVDDDATARLMGRFYRALLKEGRTPSDALRGAQRTLSRHPRWRAPYYWAGFTLQGEPR